MGEYEDLEKGRVLWLKRRRPRNEPIEYREIIYADPPLPTKPTTTSQPKAPIFNLDEELKKHIQRSPTTRHQRRRVPLRYRKKIRRLCHGNSQRVNQISIREALQPGTKLLIHAKEAQKHLQSIESELQQLKSHVVEAGENTL